MKKVVLSVAAVIALTGGATAADMKVKALKAPPAPVVTPWDIAFGAALMNDYVFRGITQSNHKPSVAGYFEGRYNFSDTLQAYGGVAGESIAFTNRAAAEIDVYAGIRPTFGAFAFDFGAWAYLYPGGTCYYGAPTDVAGNVLPADCQTNFVSSQFNILGTGNTLKKDVSFLEVYGKVTYTVNDNWALGLNEYYSPSGGGGGHFNGFLNSGAWGNYLSGTVKFTATPLSNGVGFYASGELGRQWFGTTDSFYGTPAFPNGIHYADYNTWNIGAGITYKAFTLDARYSDTNLTKAQCNAFTGDFATTNASPTFVTPINPGNGTSAFGSNWCGATGIVKLSVDTTLNGLK